MEASSVFPVTADYQHKNQTKSFAEKLFDKVIAKDLENKSLTSNNRFGKDLSNENALQQNKAKNGRNYQKTRNNVKKVRFLEESSEGSNESQVVDDISNEAPKKKKKAIRTYGKSIKNDSKRRGTIRKKKYPECTKEAVLEAFKKAGLPDFDEIARIPLSIRVMNSDENEGKKSDQSLTKKEILKPFIPILSSKSRRRRTRIEEKDDLLDKENPVLILDIGEENNSESKNEKEVCNLSSNESTKESSTECECSQDSVVGSQPSQSSDTIIQIAERLDDNQKTDLNSSETFIIPVEEKSSLEILIREPTLSLETTLPIQKRGKEISTPLVGSTISPRFGDLSCIKPIASNKSKSKEAFLTPRIAPTLKKKPWNVATRRGTKLIPPHPAIFDEPNIISNTSIPVSPDEKLPIDWTQIHNIPEMDESIQNVFSATDKSQQDDVRASLGSLRSLRITLSERQGIEYYRHSIIEAAHALHAIGKSCRTIVRESPLKRRTLRKPKNEERAVSFLVAFDKSYLQQENIKVPLTAKEKVLALCNPPKLIDFERALEPELTDASHKIGEGSYGEVFKTSAEDGEEVVLKVVPLLLSSGPEEDVWAQVLPELVISLAFKDLSYGPKNKTPNFVNTMRASCVKGKWPQGLINAWDEYNKQRKSDNDHPDTYSVDHIFLIILLANGGIDLENYQFDSATQSLSVILQTACSLAAAEAQFEFEHRDLHTGNVLVMPWKESVFEYKLDGQLIKLDSMNIKVSIIDFTLARMSKDGYIVYDDLAKYQDLFEGTGDYQFEVYRLMRDANKNNWQDFTPYSNILWIHYLTLKMIEDKKYKSRSKAHNVALKSLKNLLDNLLSYKSTKQLVKSAFFRSILSQASSP